MKTALALAVFALAACGSESLDSDLRYSFAKPGDPEPPVEGILGAPFRHLTISARTSTLTGVLQKSRTKQHEGQPMLSIQTIGGEATEAPLLIRVVSPLKIEWANDKGPNNDEVLHYRVGDTYEMVGHEEARLGGVNQEGVPLSELVSAPGRGYDHYFVASKITRVRSALSESQPPR